VRLVGRAGVRLVGWAGVRLVGWAGVRLVGWAGVRLVGWAQGAPVRARCQGGRRRLGRLRCRRAALGACTSARTSAATSYRRAPRRPCRRWATRARPAAPRGGCAAPPGRPAATPAHQQKAHHYDILSCLAPGQYLALLDGAAQNAVICRQHAQVEENLAVGPLHPLALCRARDCVPCLRGCCASGDGRT
jgi:hypothetical protein